MSAEPTPTLTRPLVPETTVTDELMPRVTREEAEAARRHAAEIGDYVTAQRWYWHERILPTQDGPDDRA